MHSRPTRSRVYGSRPGYGPFHDQVDRANACSTVDARRWARKPGGFTMRWPSALVPPVPFLESRRPYPRPRVKS